MEKAKITFVCHSMGGIIARYLLEANHNEFRNKRVGLVLIASPSIGSKLANNIGNLLNFFNHRQGVQLKWGSESLTDLDDRFRNMKEHKLIPDLSGIELYENHFIVHSKWFPLFTRKLVVTKESAGRYFASAKQISKTDHFSICKPPDKTAQVHEYLFDFLSENEVFLKSTVSTFNVPSPSDDELVAQINDKDPVTTGRALRFLKGRPDLLPKIVDQYPSGTVAVEAVRSLLRLYPELSGRLLMERLNKADPDKGWHVARGPTFYFDPVHAPFCENKLYKNIKNAVWGNYELGQLSIDALGRCGSTVGWGSTLRELLKSQLYPEGNKHYIEKFGGYVILALARFFVRSVETHGFQSLGPCRNLRDEPIFGNYALDKQGADS